jgi:D-alanyl-D-alanine carboxypeptidase
LAQEKFSQKPCGKNYSAVFFEEKTGEILFQKRADLIAYPASLVKMMTLYLTFEAIENKELNLDQEIKVSARGEEISKVNKSNTLRLKEGDKITVRQAIRGVIVKSFNEAAVSLAEAVAENEWNFSLLMNKKAAELGMINTNFHNSSGLHEEGQYTTAYDLARLARAVKKDFPQYYHLFALKEFDYGGVKYKTHNHVLTDYKGAEGMKTGFTNASGFNLISAAKKNDERVISVLLGCATFQSRDSLTKNLLDESFKKLKQNQKFEAKLANNFNYENELENSDNVQELADILNF